MRDSESIRKHSPGFVITAGTQVVLKVSKLLGAAEDQGPRYRKPGSVGIVIEAPSRSDGTYLIEFASGETVRATFDELSLRRQEIDTELSESGHDLSQFIIYRCQVGSKAYGLDGEDSDDDIRGIFLPQAHLHWSLFAIPEQLERCDQHHDEVFWELGKFVRLALKSNPNILETLWTPIVLQATDVAEELRSIRNAFLSKHIYKTYSGYVLSQFRRMRSRFEKSGQYKVKHAMHLVRLLLSGIRALQTGEILVEVQDHRQELLNIRAGNLSFEEVRQRALELDREFQSAFETTQLPEQPDFKLVDDFYIRARRSVVE